MENLKKSLAESELQVATLQSQLENSASDKTKDEQIKNQLEFIETYK